MGLVYQRGKLLYLTVEDAFAVLSGRARLRGLPAGCFCDRAAEETRVDERFGPFAEIETGRIGFRLHHPEFPANEEGELLPIFEPGEVTVEPIPDAARDAKVTAVRQWYDGMIRKVEETLAAPETAT